MSVVYIALPIALGLGALGLLACIACIRSGQFDDLDTPPLRMLLEDKSQPNRASSARAEDAPKQPHETES